MIQFIRFATIDPEGFALVKLDDISSFQTHSVQDEVSYSRLITCHEEFIVRGSMQALTELMRGWLGSEWDTVEES